jgi:hypothetical protein
MVSEEEKEDSEKGFKVQDRRRFSAEGELKPEYRGQESPEQPTAQESISAGQPRAASEESLASPRGRVQASMDPSPPHLAGEINFGTFVVGLSTQALVHLGEIPDPHSRQSAQDLPAAQQLIDIIAMLEEKTRSNLDRDEQSLLEGILFELRMKYVERARR